MSLSVDEYLEKFDEILVEVDILETIAMDCFLGGLRPDIQLVVDTFKWLVCKKVQLKL